MLIKAVLAGSCGACLRAGAALVRSGLARRLRHTGRVVEGRPGCALVCEVSVLLVRRA